MIPYLLSLGLGKLNWRMDLEATRPSHFEQVANGNWIGSPSWRESNPHEKLRWVAITRWHIIIFLAGLVSEVGDLLLRATGYDTSIIVTDVVRYG